MASSTSICLIIFSLTFAAFFVPHDCIEDGGGTIVREEKVQVAACNHKKDCGGTDCWCCNVKNICAWTEPDCKVNCPGPSGRVELSRAFVPPAM
ncbi:hypothetical protein C2S53_006775 [Perilla frutescens var. hirtella]|uniref:Uncharacterized protein n=1 Tax=Perilla frutescens var. hirtella TaxID=608512 RepID=A0AAD4P8M0_PERFH|nr:hypothetical protein C2S53_006775 [Perilla frutescens var. hirtella]